MICALLEFAGMWTNYKEYWRVKVTITNFSYNMNYTQWNLVVQWQPHSLFSFHYKSLTPYGATSSLSIIITKERLMDTAYLLEFLQITLLCLGMKFYNDLLMQAGSLGNVRKSCYFAKIYRLLLLRMGGLSPTEFISMLRTVSCHFLIHIGICSRLDCMEGFFGKASGDTDALYGILLCSYLEAFSKCLSQ